MTKLYDFAADTSNSTGNGSIVLLDAAPALYNGTAQSIHNAASDGEELTVRVYGTDLNGAAAETFTGIYTASSKTLTRVTVHTSLGAVSPVNFTAITAVELVPAARQLQRAMMPIVDATLTSAGVVLTPNHHHRITCSGLTGHREIELPNDAAKDDVFSWELVTAAHADYEVVLAIEGSAGSLLNGTDITAGSDYYRYYTINESGMVRCSNAGGDGDTDYRMPRHWDGRIPNYFNSANEAFTAGGVGWQDADGPASMTSTIGSLGITWDGTADSNLGAFVFRRAGHYSFHHTYKWTGATVNQLYGGKQSVNGAPQGPEFLDGATVGHHSVAMSIARNLLRTDEVGFQAYEGTAATTINISSMIQEHF